MEGKMPQENLWPRRHSIPISKWVPIIHQVLGEGKPMMKFGSLSGLKCST